MRSRRQVWCVSLLAATVFINKNARRRATSSARHKLCMDLIKRNLPVRNILTGYQC